MRDDVQGFRPPRFGPVNPQGIVEPFDVVVGSALEGQAVPAREWFWQDYIPWHQVTLLSGAGGINKTTFGMQLMASSAQSNPCLKMETRACKAFGVFCEDSEEEVHRRFADILTHFGASFGDLEDRMAWISREGAGLDLATFPYDGGVEPTMEFHRLVRTVTDFGAQFLLLDSLHDLFTGNENNRITERADAIEQVE